MLAFIQWAPDPTVFTIGNYSIRWYALCWCCALLLAYWNMHRLYRDQRIPEEKFEPLFFYCFVFLLLGARLGHCLFYEPYLKGNKTSTLSQRNTGKFAFGAELSLKF